MEKAMVTRDEVIYAYRLLLGRDPENEAAIQSKLGVPNWVDLRDHFIQCGEFRAKSTPAIAPGNAAEYLMTEPSRVDVDICQDDFASLVGHVQRAWQTLGAEKPYWSVVTCPSFLPEKIEENLDNFYESGAQTWKIFECAAARAGKAAKSEWIALELGCGVGRVTEQLARRFRRVLAYDISRAHLDLARSHLVGRGIDNVAFSQLAGLDSLLAAEPFDFFYSVIVLQHNPPPLIHRMLQIIFERLRPGGLAYFQIPVGSHGYQFSIDQYLEHLMTGSAGMEMHMLPQKQLFALLHECRLRILDFQTDNLTGPGFQSVSVLAEKLAPLNSAD
jgi:SAM-dependent methyltransferase